MSKFILPVTMDTLTRKRDRSARLSFVSNVEITSADMMAMDILLHTTGHLVFSSNEVQDSDIPDEPAQTKDGKSKSQRLRAVYFLLWKQSGTDEPFENYYARIFEQLMDKLKERLD
jgi:hypothetical protein